ncbi:MAG: hypothetical protein LQ342_000713 [Letrouitia transgressa]|nr:MAG: hypothetical protein LQ342_000713 [Letrouitia transgressa]
MSIPIRSRVAVAVAVTVAVSFPPRSHTGGLVAPELPRLAGYPNPAEAAGSGQMYRREDQRDRGQEKPGFLMWDEGEKDSCGQSGDHGETGFAGEWEKEESGAKQKGQGGDQVLVRGVEAVDREVRRGGVIEE